MNYDEHFGYVEMEDHCILAEYLEKKILTSTSAEIPETFNGKPVTMIGREAFKDAVYLECVTFPDSVTGIEESAFSGCSSLREIAWANGLKYIEYSAFEWCTALERLEFPEGLQTINMEAFRECASLKEVVLPHSLDLLESYAFNNCGELEKITFLKKDIMLGDFAFKGCAKLPAETLMYPLTNTCNIEKPFVWYSFGFAFEWEFDWDTALREDVFALAMEHNSFENVDKYELFARLFHNNLMERYFPYMKKHGWIYREEQIKPLATTLRDYFGGKVISTLGDADWFADKELFSRLYDRLLDALVEAGNTELTAWLLEYKNRRFGFDVEDNYEL